MPSSAGRMIPEIYEANARGAQGTSQARWAGVGIVRGDGFILRDWRWPTTGKVPW
jgi:hypothetical protein